MDRDRDRCRRALWGACVAALLLGMFSLVPPPQAAAADALFLRGDVNSDGKVSISDSLMLRRWLFIPDSMEPTCLDAADADDNGDLDITDEVIIISALFLGNPLTLMEPFPLVGADPTPDDIGRNLGCQSYEPVPPGSTSDIVRLGKVEAVPGQEVIIPVYMTLSQEVEAFQLVVSYDPVIFAPPGPSYSRGIIFEGTIFESLYPDRAEQGYRPDYRALREFPDQGILIISLASNISDEEHNIPPGTDILVLKFKMPVSPDAQPGTVISLDLTNGPDGQGVTPPYYIQNELTYRGAGKLLSVLPQRISGKVAIVDDLTFFIRGDANSDKLVDISDPIFVLSYLFLGGQPPSCMDAADADDSGILEITDAVDILMSLYQGADSIAEPYPAPGKDPTGDDLSCGL